MDTLLHDLRYAGRSLLRSPGFAAVAVLTLALGIGINTTIFSVVNSILIRPFPQLRTEGLVQLRATRPAQGVDDGGITPADLYDWREQTASFEAIAGYGDDRRVLVAGGGDPEEVEAEAVTPDLFPLLGARPAMGRLFLPEEGTPGRNQVAILTHHMWERRFGSDPAVVGKTIRLDGVPHTVVGVMPPRFGFPDNQPLWVPMALRPGEGRGSHYLRAVARLRPGVTLEQARAELAAVARRLEAQHPETNTGWSVAAHDF
ncbi:MAG TPA: ABC transporter permease, partial [Longimicrobiaceae bacterium]